MHDLESGMFVRTRISLRREFRRQPTIQEVEMEMVAAGHDFKNTVSVDDIMRAYDKGEEVSRHLESI
jgi:hypothetical protein